MEEPTIKTAVSFRARTNGIMIFFTNIIIQNFMILQLISFRPHKCRITTGEEELMLQLTTVTTLTTGWPWQLAHRGCEEIQLAIESSGEEELV